MVKVFTWNVNVDGKSKMLLIGFPCGTVIQCPVMPMNTSFWGAVNRTSQFFPIVNISQGKENGSTALKGPGPGEQPFPQIRVSQPWWLRKPRHTGTAFTPHSTQRTPLALRARTVHLARPETRAPRLCFFKKPACLQMKQYFNLAFHTESFKAV